MIRVFERFVRRRSSAATALVDQRWAGILECGMENSIDYYCTSFG